MSVDIIGNLLGQMPVAGVFAYFAWLNFRQTVKTLDHYQNVLSMSLGRVLDQLAILEERTRNLGKDNQS